MNTTGAAAFDANRALLWGLLYRMTGCAADADDLVQETFVRLLEKRPEGDAAALRPWLVRVGLNLAKDLLRRRRRRPYVGPWLPSPVSADAARSQGLEAESAVEAVEAVASGNSTEGRYDLVESMSLAFLVALEALTPRQRAVLLLRDVFDYTVIETGAALEMSGDAVKASHLRARRAMAAYEDARTRGVAEVRQRALEALVDFTTALAMGDVAAVERLLASDVRSLSDGGGEFYAALNPVVGPSAVARLYLGLFRRWPSLPDIRPIDVGGLPALFAEFPETTDPRLAPRFVLQVDLDRDGLIRRVYVCAASRKLTHVA